MVFRIMKHTKNYMAILLLILIAVLPALSADPIELPLADLKVRIGTEYSGRIPHEWAETVRGVHTRLKTRENVLALTLDACGGAAGKGFDTALISFLEREQIPATLFINARWIDSNPELFSKLALNP